MGFVQAHFDLKVMIACPMHRRMLLRSCPVCGNSLTFYRRGLLTCKCGVSLAGLQGKPAGDNICDLLDIVERKTLKLPMLEEYRSGSPGGDLGKMSLCSILALIRILGRHASPPRTGSQKEDYPRWVKTAADVLSNWPHRLHESLARREPRASTRNPFSLRSGRISSLYGALHRAGIDFVLEAISDYAVAHFGPGSHIQRAKRSEREINSRYVNKRQFAKMCGIDVRSVDQLIKKYKIPTVKIRRGQGKRTLIDVKNNLIPPMPPGCICRASRAASMIGIPKSVLIQLKRDGTYEAASLPVRSSGFHQQDIEQFIRRLIAFADPSVSCSEEGIRFDRIMKRSTIPVRAKVALIRKALSGELPIYGSHDGTTRGLIFPKSIVDQESRRAWPGMIPLDVANQLGCSCHTVRELAKRGLLYGLESGGTYRFTQKDVDKFRKEWSSLALLAHRTNTSAWGLLRLCSRLKIPLITVPWRTRRESQGFVKTRDVGRLLAIASELLGKENRAKRKRLHRLGEY
jgi:excisionase family DNA binding protein